MATLPGTPSLNPAIDISDIVSVETDTDEYLNNNTEDNVSSKSKIASNNADLGIVTSPKVILVFLVGQLVTFFALNVVGALSTLWPADIVLLSTTIAAFMLWYDLVRIIDYIISRHSNPRWVEGWRKVVGFISYTLIMISAAYAIQLLRLLWISGSVSVIQSIVVTIAGVFALMFILISFSDDLSTSEVVHLQKELKVFLKAHQDKILSRKWMKAKQMHEKKTQSMSNYENLMKPITSHPLYLPNTPPSFLSSYNSVAIK